MRSFKPGAHVVCSPVPGITTIGRIAAGKSRAFKRVPVLWFGCALQRARLGDGACAISIIDNHPTAHKAARNNVPDPGGSMCWHMSGSCGAMCLSPNTLQGDKIDCCCDPQVDSGWCMTLRMIRLPLVHKKRVDAR